MWILWIIKMYVRTATINVILYVVNVVLRDLGEIKDQQDRKESREMLAVLVQKVIEGNQVLWGHRVYLELQEPEGREGIPGQ